MFMKAALVKFALAPLAAVTLLAQVAAASPTARQLQRRQDDGFAPDSYHWPPGGDRDCRPDRDRLPKIVKPDRNTVWRVGDRQQVVWEKKRPWDDWKHGKDDDNWKHGKDDKSKKDDKDDKDQKHGKDHRRPRCKTQLTLRKGHGFRPVTLAENFDLDAGSVGVTVPDVPPDDDYTVTLSLGKLESTSDRFRIKKKDCKGWWCKDDDKDHKDDHGDKDGKDGKDRHDNKDCKDWWCKDRDGKDDKDHHDDKDGKDGKDGKGKDGNANY